MGKKRPRAAAAKSRDPKGRQAAARKKRIGPNSAAAKRIRASRPTARKNKDGTVSTVLMADSGRKVFPTLFPKKKGGGFIELGPRAAFSEAKKRGEVIVTRTVADAAALARGAWKKPVKRKPVKKSLKRRAGRKSR